MDKRFTEIRPVMSDCGKEPSLKTIIEDYYYSKGVSFAKEIAEDYINKWCELESNR